MNSTKLNTSLKTLAIQHGLCKQWQNEWREDETVDSLMQKFLRGIDFYISTRFITKRQMQLWFSKDDLHKHNIVVNEKRSILNPKCGIVVGNAEVTIRCNSRHVCSFYAVDNTKLTVIMHDKAHLKLTLCDNAEIEKLDISPDADLYICRAGESTKVAVFGDSPNIKITDNYHLYDQ